MKYLNICSIVASDMVMFNLLVMAEGFNLSFRSVILKQFSFKVLQIVFILVLVLVLNIPFFVLIGGTSVTFLVCGSGKP